MTRRLYLLKKMVEKNMDEITLIVKFLGNWIICMFKKLIFEILTNDHIQFF